MPANSVPIRILGRHSLLNEALATLISKLPAVEVVGETAHNGAPDELSRAAPPEVVLWFFQPSDEDGVFSWIQQHPQARVLLISGGWTGAQARTALQNGAAGCIYTNASLQELGEAIRQIDSGEPYLSPELARAIILDDAQNQAVLKETPLESLSQREWELVPLLCQGSSNKQIAQQLYLSVRTVENHLSSIYAKLGVRSRTEVAVLAIQLGWVSLK